MSVERQSLLVALALLLAVGVTGAFVLLSGDETEKQFNPDQDDSLIPSPATHDNNGTTSQNNNRTIGKDDNPTPVPLVTVEDTGDPPEATGTFAPFEEVATDIGLSYEGSFARDGPVGGSGLYVVDHDNDGYEDLLAIGGDRPVLFENVGGSYERLVEFDQSRIQAAHFFDYNNNGYRDLVLAEFGGSLHFYENDAGTYRERPDLLEYSVIEPTAITSADFTGNGCLDLFVAQRGLWQQGHPMERQHAQDVSENHPDVRPEPVPGTENRLFYSNCEDFTDRTTQSGISGEYWSLAVSAADFSRNGFPDIHVANDFSGDFLYLNSGHGTFDRHELGSATDRNAMSSVVRDMTGNHLLDLFVTNIYIPEGSELTTSRWERERDAPVPKGNNLLVNEGGGTFTDRAPEHGVHAGGWGWAALLEDLNNDGHIDIVHATSADVPVEDYDQYRGLQFWKGTAESWERVDSRDFGIASHDTRGLVRVDYANDGRLDLALATTPMGTRRGGDDTRQFRVYQNTHDENRSLQFFVRNPDGVERHATVLVETDNRTIYRTANARSDLLSQDSRLFHVGFGNEQLERVRVVWPDGTESVYDDLQIGNRYILTPGNYERVE